MQKKFTVAIVSALFAMLAIFIMGTGRAPAGTALSMTSDLNGIASAAFD